MRKSSQSKTFGARLNISFTLPPPCDLDALWYFAKFFCQRSAAKKIRQISLGVKSLPSFSSSLSPSRIFSRAASNSCFLALSEIKQNWLVIGYAIQYSSKANWKLARKMDLHYSEEWERCWVWSCDKCESNYQDNVATSWSLNSISFCLQQISDKNFFPPPERSRQMRSSPKRSAFPTSLSHVSSCH